MVNLKKGFTLIELLVVIAIIGILSSVVLASLNTARNKGADAAVKSNLNNIRAQAELVYDEANPNSYAGVCANTQVSAAVNAAITAAGSGTVATRCGNSASAWAVWSNLKTTGAGWCLDSLGTSKQIGTGGTGAIPAGAVTVCP